MKTTKNFMRNTESNLAPCRFLFIYDDGGYKFIQYMNIADLEHKLNGTTPMPKCNDLYTLLGVVKGKGYSCPKCEKQEDDYDISEGYNVDGENYPKCYNESKGGTIDGNYWDWDEVHCCTGCGTKYWFRNGAY